MTLLVLPRNSETKPHTTTRAAKPFLFARSLPKYGEFRRLGNFSMPRPVLGAKIPPARSTHDLAQQKRQNRGTTLPHTPDGTPAPHLHSQQAVCDGECERNSHQYCRAPDAFPPRHPKRSVHRDHGHLSHTGALPAVQGSGPRPSSAGGNSRPADGDSHLLSQHHQ